MTRRRLRPMRLLERVAVVLVSLVIAGAIIILLSGGPLAGRDTPGLYGAAQSLGYAYRDLGDSLLPAGPQRVTYDSNPPTSGPHRAEKITATGQTISNDQLLQALAAGDVVFMYGTRRPSGALTALARSIAAPFSPALAGAGQAVILARRPGVPGVLGLAWTRMLAVRTGSDPQLRTFALYWLGRGAQRR